METKDFFGLKTGERLPDPTSVNVSNMIEDMWGTYKDAVTSLLCELEAAAMDLEAGQNTAENLATIRRLLHSIKGDSGMTGFADVHNFCHQAETFFEEITDTSAKADMVLKAKDWIEAVINHVSGIDIVAHKESHAQEAAKQRLKALVVDDDRVCRKRLKMLLSDFFDCSYAVDGQQGLEMYIESCRQNSPYDFITLDINMPRLNGHDTLEAIRRYETEHDIAGLDGVKVIMTTSESESKHIVGAFREGCEAYVVKLNMGDKLLDEIAKLGLLKVVKVQKDYVVG